MTDFLNFWDFLRVFPRYSRFQRVAIVGGLPLLIYCLYLLTAARPPLNVYSLEGRFSRRITANGPLTPEGNVIITFEITNLSQPGGELHNIAGEFWTRKSFVIKQSHAPAREIAEFVYYDFNLPLVYKNSGALLFEWVLRSPDVGREIPLGFRIVASEVDWQIGSWSIVNDGSAVQLRDNSKKR
jgi:hypothetical protein